MTRATQTGIKAIDKSSVHRITSGQVVVDLQTAVKELVENSVDAGATNIEVRFKQNGLHSIEVIDDGHGIAEEDFEGIALKHHTSKLGVFEDLATVNTFGFRGEALSSLCALCEHVQVTTATEETSPKGTCLELDFSGGVESQRVVARKRGTTVVVSKLFSPLPVRRKELERSIKREYGKALSLLHAYALGPCSTNSGIRLTVSNTTEKGQKTIQLQTRGTPSLKATTTALWGPKAADSLVDLDISFEVETEKSVVKRLKTFKQPIPDAIEVAVKGLVSKFVIGHGRLNSDRQYFYLNGRPCNLNKVQKAFNDVYRSFNVNQLPFIVADFIIPTNSIDVNVSPDKRTVLIHNEDSIISALKATLEQRFQPSRSTFDLSKSQDNLTQTSLVAFSQAQPPILPHPKTIPSASHSDSSPSSSPFTDSGDKPSSAVVKTPLSTGLASKRPIPSEQDEYDYPMEIDEHHDPAGTTSADETPFREQSPLSEDGDITLDTRSASWDVPLVKRALEEQEHSRKRRRLPPEEAGRTSSLTTSNDNFPTPSVPHSRKPSQAPSRTNRNTGSQSVKKKTSSASVWDQLSSFAAPGSQLPQREDERSNASGEACEGEHPSVSPEEELLSATSSQGYTDDVQRPVIIDVDEPITEEQGDEEASERDPIQEVELEKDDGLGEHEHVQDRSEDDKIEEGETTDQESDATPDLYSSQKGASDLPPVTSSQRPEIIKHAESNTDVSLEYDVDRVAKLWSSRLKPSTEEERDDTETPKIPPDASISNADNSSRASDALARVINKEDFASMIVVGQFNLGFIIVRRNQRDSKNSVSMDDLFIVDQHAADEKYNFETLQLTTKIQAQKLLRPRMLELTAADELLATENIAVLRSNGFEVEVVDEDSAPTQAGRLRLTAQPVSKSTVFDMKDLEELIHLIGDSPSGTMVRCSKARAMFASRACRKSVMVGMPLNHSQMLALVRHMGTMDQPWNCPHGRPTMRHLADIAASGQKPSKDRSICWTSFS